MQHLRLRITAAAQPAFDVQHAAGVAEHHGIGATDPNVFAFAFGNKRRNATELDSKGTAESAALFTFISRSSAPSTCASSARNVDGRRLRPSLRLETEEELNKRSVPT